MSAIQLEVFVGNAEGISDKAFHMNTTTQTIIQELKNQFFEKFQVPVGRQEWIIRNVITMGQDSLEELKVKPQNFAVVYIKTTEEVSKYRDAISIPEHFSLAFREALAEKYHGALLCARIPKKPAVPSTLKESPLPSSRRTELGAWQCTKCTLINSPQCTVCKVCNQPSGRAVVKTEPTTGEQMQRASAPSTLPRHVPPPPPQPARPMSVDEIRIAAYGWECPKCTVMNEPTRPGCLLCAESRPEYYQLPPDEHLTAADVARLQRWRTAEMAYNQYTAEEKLRNQQEAEVFRQELIYADEHQKFFHSSEEFQCGICLEPIAVGEGVILRNCTHTFCRDCLREIIINSNDVRILCPAQMGDGNVCSEPLQDREIHGILENEAEYQERLRRATAATLEKLAGEGGREKVFRCLTPNCEYVVLYEHEDVGPFVCPICNLENCIRCKVQHAPMSCQEFQDERRRVNLREANQNMDAKLEEELLNNGQAMRCPGCTRVTVKNGGCPNMVCKHCKQQFVWQPRVAQ